MSPAEDDSADVSSIFMKVKGICHKFPDDNICYNTYIVISLEQVTVTPTTSSDYNLIPLSGDQYSSCLCGNERKTLKWTMAPVALGERPVNGRNLFFSIKTSEILLSDTF